MIFSARVKEKALADKVIKFCEENERSKSYLIQKALEMYFKQQQSK